MEQTLEQEQEQQIAKLTKKIERLEKETNGKQSSLDQVRGHWRAPGAQLAAASLVWWAVVGGREGKW